jgi:uncharacterized protein YidB (DUF937 family)
MSRFRSRKALAIGAAALAVAGGGGAAVAAQGSSSPGQSFLDAVAKHLGVSSDELEDATKAAAVDQVDSALADGKITQAQADELKQRIESGEFPPFFGGPFFGRPFGDPFRHAGPPPLPLFGERLSAAADYLGLTVSQLRAKLNDGQTLAEIAKTQGKSVDGLKRAIVGAAETKLDELVQQGELTQAQADATLERLKSHIDDLVENGVFRFHFRGPVGHEHGAHPFW